MEHAPVRVLLVLTVRYSKNGIARYVETVVETLDGNSVRCDVVSPNEPDAAFADKVRLGGGEVFVLPQRNRRPFSYMRALANIVRARDEQIVHAHGNSATLYAEMAAARRGGARVRIAHSHNTSCKMRLADKLLRSAFYRSYTQGCACGEAAGRWLFGHRPFTVLNNAVDTARYRFDAEARSRVREELGISQDAFVVLHVGTFDARKNQSFLLEAMRRLVLTRPNAVLLLTGEGHMRQVCQARAAEWGLADCVRFTGARDDVHALMSAADAFALPSLAEGLPFTMVEAQCAGLPCFVSDRVSREAALGGEVAFLPIDDAARWAEKLGACQAGDRASASSAGIERASAAGYDLDRNANRLADWYNRLVSEAQACKGS